ncbi:hypothetical protein LN650_01820 [Klebsiella pneumoniae subsp. pneumoniae]|nr:hypothetical protein [Klebsiella pneumoniae subsp. pneumoniae]
MSQLLSARTAKCGADVKEARVSWGAEGACRWTTDSQEFRGHAQARGALRQSDQVYYATLYRPVLAVAGAGEFSVACCHQPSRWPSLTGGDNVNLQRLPRAGIRSGASYFMIARHSLGC